jgi:hypothetical protein
MLRFGAGERTEIGLRTAKLAAWGFDVKVRLLKTRTVDVAVNPMVQIVFDEGPGPHLHLPLLVGFNVTRRTGSCRPCASANHSGSLVIDEPPLASLSNGCLDELE